MFVGGLVGRTTQRRRLHPQTLQGNRLAAIRAVTVLPAIQTLQSGFHLSQFAEVALLLYAAKIQQLPLRRLVLAVRHFVRRSAAQFALILLASVDFGAQFPQATVQRIAQLRQISLSGEVHGLWFR